MLRRFGTNKFETPNEWSFAYLEWGKPEYYAKEDGSQGIARYSSWRYDPGPSYTASEANYATYGFTVELHNTMDVASTLRNVHVAFMKNGQTIFVHRPFDEDSEHDRVGGSLRQ